MVYNKGTVSFDQWVEKFFEQEVKGNILEENLREYYNDGMDIEEALMQFENDKA